MKLVIPRMAATLAVAIALMVVIALTHPQQLPVTLYKLSLIMVAAVVGYWIDRELFPYARPDSFQDCSPDALDKPSPNDGEDDGPLYALILPLKNHQALLFAVAQIRRAIVVSACIIAVALGA